MGMDYKIYENWYKYMSNVFDQIQSFSNTYGQSSISSVKQSSDTFMDTLMKINALRSQGEDGAQIGSQGADASEQSMDAIFAEAAERYDVPLNLLKAMGKAESGFDANAVSPAGAQGVMQLMPSTAKSLGVEDPFDARSNIMGGAKYISQKLKQYNGNIDLALAAYNAGSGNVAKYGGVPPFSETRNYIARIKGYMNSDLTINKTVSVRTEGKGTVSSDPILADGAQGTSGTQNGSGTYRLSQTDAQYFVDLMRLQMLSRSSYLSWASGDTDGQNSFIL